MISRVVRDLAVVVALIALNVVIAVALWRLVGLPRGVARFVAIVLVALWDPQGYGRPAWRHLRRERHGPGPREGEGELGEDRQVGR